MPLANSDVALTIVIGTALTLFFAIIIVFLFILFNNKNTLNMKEREMVRRQFEKSLIQSQLEIKEQTLRNIANELHDNLGQIASLIKINLTTITLHDVEKATRQLDDTKELVKQMIHDLKTLSVSLNSDRITHYGIVKALEIDVERLNKTGMFAASISVDGTPPPVDPDKTIIIYRMSQEIINNMVKHSNATNISISLKTTPTLFTLVFRDDGVGFNPELEGSSGSGLTNLKTRAKLIGSSLAIQSSRENGTQITIELSL